MTDSTDWVRVLREDAEKERQWFIDHYGHDGNCSCHISPPCSSCIHPGNPANQEESEECWEWEPLREFEDVPFSITELINEVFAYINS